jgi:hypothetical protein
MISWLVEFEGRTKPIEKIEMFGISAYETDLAG